MSNKLTLILICKSYKYNIYFIRIKHETMTYKYFSTFKNLNVLYHEQCLINPRVKKDAKSTEKVNFKNR